MIRPTPLPAATILALAGGFVLGGCAVDPGPTPAHTPASAYRASNPVLDELRRENQRKLSGFPTLYPGMSEVDARRAMGARPVSPAPGVLEYTAYIHGDADVIYIYTLVFANGRLKEKSVRQIPPQAAPLRSATF